MIVGSGIDVAVVVVGTNDSGNVGWDLAAAAAVVGCVDGTVGYWLLL